MADKELRVEVVVNTAALTAGMEQASSAVQSASERMASSLKTAGMSSADASSALKNLGFTSTEASAALQRAGFEVLQVSQKAIVATGSVTGMDRAMAMGTARVAGFAGGAGMLGSALGRVGAASSTLAPLLAAAFPILGALALADILGSIYEKLRKVSMEGLENADNWQKINHESAAAMEAAIKGIEHLEVKLEDLTRGKMAALRLEMKFIGDGAVEMSGKMLTLFDGVGKQLEKEIPLLDKVREFYTFVNTNGLILRNQGELAKAFGSELSKTLDTQGTAAGIHLVAEQIRLLNAEIAKSPDDKGLREYRDQLEKVRALLATGLQKEGLEKAVNVAEQAKESAREIQKMREELSAFAAKMRELEKERVRLADAEKNLIADSAAFRLKDQSKEIIEAAKTAVEIADTERKFQADRLKDAEDLSLAKITSEERAVEEQLRLGQISNEQARQQLNKLVADKLAIELKYLNDRASLILRRMTSDDAKAYAEDAAEWSKLLHDKQQAQIAANAAMQANDNRAATAHEKAWCQAVTAINRTFETAVRGLMAGTETFGQAWARMVNDMTAKFIAALERQAMEYLVTHVFMLAVHQSIHEKEVLADAKSAAAAAWKAVVGIPVIGPILAPIAAATAF